MKRIVWILAASLIVAGCSGSKSRLKKTLVAEAELVEAEGIAPYNASDLPATKAAALADAQRKAVELVVGVYVNAKTRVEKAVAVEQRILTHVAGYVRRYEILSEGRSGDWYKMRIRAEVSTKALHDDLDDLGLLRSPEVGNPRAALLLQEWIGEKRDSAGHARIVLSQGLLNKGFRVVELPSSIDREEDPVEVARTSARGKAEILIAGLARAQPLGYSNKELGGMASYRASVSLRVLEVGTGEVLRTVSETASGLEGTPDIAGGKSLENAAEAAVKQLASLPEELSRRSQVTLTITGLTSFSGLSQFQKALLAQPGVKDQYLRSFNQSAGEAILDIRVEGLTPQELADQSAKIGGVAWTVFQVSGRSIQISASPAGR